MLSTLDSKSKSFIEGLITPFRALELMVHHPRLMVLSIAPIVTALVALAFVIYALLAGAWNFAHAAFLSAVSAYSGIVFGIVSILLLSALGFFVMSLITFLTSFFASPMNDFLAECTEKKLGLTDTPSWNAGRSFRIIWIDLRKTILTIFTGIILSIGMLIPIANVLCFLGLALLNAFTFITYPLSRREKGISESISWMKENFSLCLGFGIATALFFSIPVLDFFALPISVVGGTLLFARTTSLNQPSYTPGVSKD